MPFWALDWIIGSDLRSGVEDVPGDIRLVMPKDDGPALVLLLLLLLEEVVSERAVGHTDARSMLTQGPPLICVDATPALPTPDIAGQNRQEVEILH